VAARPAAGDAVDVLTILVDELADVLAELSSRRAGVSTAPPSRTSSRMISAPSGSVSRSSTSACFTLKFPDMSRPLCVFLRSDIEGLLIEDVIGSLWRAATASLPTGVKQGADPEPDAV